MPIDLLPVEPVILLCAVTADSESTLEQARKNLSLCLGPIDRQTPVYPFTYTQYYASEMGAGLIKQVLSFAGRRDPAELSDVKSRTIKLEKEMGRYEVGLFRRRANLDPGVVSIESLVLATTKYSGHRICIAPALYAEVTLLFRKGCYRPLEWTYPDYRSEEVQRFLLAIRAELMAERRTRKSADSP